MVAVRSVSTAVRPRARQPGAGARRGGRGCRCRQGLQLQQKTPGAAAMISAISAAA